MSKAQGKFDFSVHYPFKGLLKSVVMQMCECAELLSSANFGMFSYQYMGFCSL